MLKTTPILHMFAPYWTMPAVYGHHTINTIYQYFVTNNYDWNASVTDMLQHVQWEPLQDRQNNFRVITMYKIANNLIDISPPEGSMQLSNSVTRGHSLRFTQLQTNVDSSKYSFYLHTITLWSDNIN